jgi:hypothetical protein
MTCNPGPTNDSILATWFAHIDDTDYVLYDSGTLYQHDFKRCLVCHVDKRYGWQADARGNMWFCDQHNRQWFDPKNKDFDRVNLQPVRPKMNSPKSVANQLRYKREQQEIHGENPTSSLQEYPQ